MSGKVSPGLWADFSAKVNARLWPAFKHGAMSGALDLQKFSENPDLIHRALVAGFSSMQEEIFISSKFALLAHLGVIIVPGDYDHATELDKFVHDIRRRFYGINDLVVDDVSDGNFPNPTRILKPGDEFLVLVFVQVVAGTTTSEERMAFCRQQPGNFFAGAQGLSLVFQQKRRQLPKGRVYISFDERERLYQDTKDHYRVPVLDASDVSGCFDFDLGCFDNAWSGDCFAFLCFCDVEPVEGRAQ